MAPRAFAGTTDEIQTSIPTAANVAFGTWACLCRKTGADGVNYNLVRSASSGGSNSFGLFVGTTNVITMACNASLSNGPTLNVASGWVFVAAGKATGNQTPRFHIARLGVDTVVTHSNGSASITNATAPGTTGHEFLGSRAGGPCWVGELALAALYPVNLTDAQVDAMFRHMSGWLAAAPVGLWLVDESSTIRDWSGNGGHETSRSGTSVSAQVVPEFDFKPDYIRMIPQMQQLLAT